MVCHLNLEKIFIYKRQIIQWFSGVVHSTPVHHRPPSVILICQYFRKFFLALPSNYFQKRRNVFSLQCCREKSFVTRLSSKIQTKCLVMGHYSEVNKIDFRYKNILTQQGESQKCPWNKSIINLRFFCYMGGSEQK